ncbi:MAG: hypothetical protein ACOH2L_19060 [Devosia sp.]
MAFTGTSLKSITRVAAVALALGASSLMAAPAFAQNGSGGFSIEMHSNGGGGFGDSQRHGRNNGWDDNARQRCLSDREVTRGISAYGYDRVEITRQRGDRVELQAVRGSWAYTMRVDKCSGQVDRLQRSGRAYGGDNHDRDGRGDHGGRRGGDNRGDYNGFDGGGSTDGGFGFQFNFGN